MPAATVKDLRDQGKRLFDADDIVEAECVFAEGQQRWPERLDLAIWRSRCFERLERLDDRRELLDAVVPNLTVDDLPGWALSALAQQGYLYQRGVWLCLNHPVISPWMRQRMQQGSYEDVESDLLAASIEPGETILEVGGGMGFIAAFACQQAADVSLVVYEANPGLVAVAEHTQQLNRVSYDFRNAMLGAAAGTARFHVHEAFWASSATHGSDDSTAIDVAVHDVNQVLAERDFTMLVMDIEGGEVDLLPQMDLRTVTRVVLETHPAVTGARSVRAMLRHLKRSFGLKPVEFREDVYLLARSR